MRAWRLFGLVMVAGWIACNVPREDEPASSGGPNRDQTPEGGGEDAGLSTPVDAEPSPDDGAEDAALSMPDDGGEDAGLSTPDDGGEDAAVEGGPPQCLKPPGTDPPSKPLVGQAGWVGAVPKGSFGCPITTASPYAHAFQLTKQTAFTMFISHTLSSVPPEVHLHDGCDLAAPLSASATDRRTHSMVLEAGLYTFVTCTGQGDFVAEPTPTPVNTNTSCATAATLPSTGVRMYDPNETRYFSFQAGLQKQYIVVTSNVGGVTMNTGNYRIEVRTACADPGTNLFDTNGNVTNPGNAWLNGPRAYNLGPLPVGTTYWVVLSAVDPGLALTISRENRIN
ncbi:MAG: hypothetical protein KF819_34890 [Labilithrix sp.]|nr:hypothetical protein [Labilithrix sp.]